MASQYFFPIESQKHELPSLEKESASVTARKFARNVVQLPCAKCVTGATVIAMWTSVAMVAPAQLYCWSGAGVVLQCPIAGTANCQLDDSASRLRVEWRKLSLKEWGFGAPVPLE